LVLFWWTPSIDPVSNLVIHCNHGLVFKTFPDGKTFECTVYTLANRQHIHSNIWFYTIVQAHIIYACISCMYTHTHMSNTHEYTSNNSIHTTFTKPGIHFHCMVNIYISFIVHSEYQSCFAPAMKNHGKIWQWKFSFWEKCRFSQNYAMIFSNAVNWSMSGII